MSLDKVGFSWTTRSALIEMNRRLGKAAWGVRGDSGIRTPSQQEKPRVRGKQRTTIQGRGAAAQRLVLLGLAREQVQGQLGEAWRRRGTGRMKGALTLEAVRLVAGVNVVVVGRSRRKKRRGWRKGRADEGGLHGVAMGNVR